MSRRSFESFGSLMASTYIPTIISPEVSFNLESSDTEEEHAHRQSHAIKRDFDESCSDWSKWRMKLNDTMIRAMNRMDQDHVPTPRLGIRRRVCNAALARAVRDKSPTFMKFEMDPESFVSFGIPRVRIEREKETPSERFFKHHHDQHHHHHHNNHDNHHSNHHHSNHSHHSNHDHQHHHDDRHTFTGRHREP